MQSLAVVGDTATARATIIACQKAGYTHITWANEPSAVTHTGASVLPANLTRIVLALDAAERLQALGHQPDRQQVRLAKSGFLLSELPLGQFLADRYGAPHVNLERSDWSELLAVTTAPPCTNAHTADLEQSHDAVLVCTDDPSPLVETGTHALWHAVLPWDRALANMNVTWLGESHCAWQFSTRIHQHVYFSTPSTQVLSAADWHPLLHPAVAAAQHLHNFDPGHCRVRERWYEGRRVYLGEACHRISPYLPEANALGLEDAWVLGRMLENYDEALAEGFSEYEKYRSARLRRVVRAAAEQARSTHPRSTWSRIGQRLNTALSTRFLPEIAMQRIDWLYGFDCIRGFR